MDNLNSSVRNNLLANTSMATTDIMPNHDRLDVDEPVIYESRHTLHTVRVVLFAVSLVYWSICLYSHDVYGFIAYCHFFTFWGQTMVNFYLFWVIMYYPKKRALSDGTVIFQQALLTIETMIVFAYWCMLAPGLGWDKAISFRRVYDHSVPFLFMIHELVVSYGNYTIQGELLGVVIFLIYSCYNVFICFQYDIIPYDTPISNPHYTATYVAIAGSLAVVFGIGRLYTKSKSAITSRMLLNRSRRMESETDAMFDKLDAKDRNNL